MSQEVENRGLTIEYAFGPQCFVHFSGASSARDPTIKAIGGTLAIKGIFDN